MKKNSEIVERKPPWKFEELIAAIKAGTIEEKVELLRRIGILDEDGKLAKKYSDREDGISRACDEFYLEREFGHEHDQRVGRSAESVGSSEGARRPDQGPREAGK